MRELATNSGSRTPDRVVHGAAAGRIARDSAKDAPRRTRRWLRGVDDPQQVDPLGRERESVPAGSSGRADHEPRAPKVREDVGDEPGWDPHLRRDPRGAHEPRGVGFVVRLVLEGQGVLGERKHGSHRVVASEGQRDPHLASLRATHEHA